MRELFLLMCAGAETCLTRLVAASLLGHPSEQLKLRVSVGCLLQTAPSAIPALREFDLCWLSRAQGWLALMALAVLSLPSKLSL